MLMAVNFLDVKQANVTKIFINPNKYQIFFEGYLHENVIDQYFLCYIFSVWPCKKTTL